MKKLLLLLPLLLLGCTDKPQNYAECILKDMPGTTNNQARGIIHSQCRDAFPETYYAIDRGYARGQNNIQNEKQCIVHYGKETLNSAALANIRQACGCLYGDTQIKDQRCAYNLSEFDPSTAKVVS